MSRTFRLLALLSLLVGPRLEASPAPAAASQLRVVLVVDASASMTANDPRGLVKAAARRLVEGLAGTDEAGLVIFDEEARLVAPVRPMGSPGARQALLAALDGVAFTGRWTDIPRGVERALYELKQHQGPGREAMIVVTDGLIDTGSAAVDQARARWLRDELLPDCAASGVRVVGVAFTEKADFSLLQGMAHATSGAYFRALGTDDVGSIFEDVRRALDEPTAAEKEAASRAASAAAAAAARASLPQRPVSPPPAAQGPSSQTVILLVSLMAVGVAVLLALLLRRDRPRRARIAPGGAPMDPRELELDLGLLDDDESRHGILQDVATGERHRIAKHLTTLGRRTDNDIIVDERTVSGQHSQVVRRAGHFYVTDLRSTNGTWLNDRRVEGETLLRAGDVLRLDQHAFRFEGELPAGAESWPEGEGTVLRLAPPDDVQAPPPWPGEPPPPWPGEGRRGDRHDRPEGTG